MEGVGLAAGAVVEAGERAMRARRFLSSIVAAAAAASMAVLVVVVVVEVLVARSASVRVE